MEKEKAQKEAEVKAQKAKEQKELEDKQKVEKAAKEKKDLEEKARLQVSFVRYTISLYYWIDSSKTFFFFCIYSIFYFLFKEQSTSASISGLKLHEEYMKKLEVCKQEKKESRYHVSNN